MDFMKLAKERYSCRKFSDKRVEKEMIDKIIEAGRIAPTAVNRQPFKIFIMNSEHAKTMVRENTTCTFNADCFLIMGYKDDEGWIRKYDDKNFSEIDAVIAATHMMLEIQDLGLATTWVGYFNEPKLKRNFPEMKDYKLIAIFPVGYAADDAIPSENHFKRKTTEMITEVL